MTDHPMTIDAEKLEDELKRADAIWSEEAKGGLIVAAARAHLATLPRYKEVEREAWEVLDHDGVCHGVFGTEEGARRASAYSMDRFFVRLTGTAKVRA